MKKLSHLLLMIAAGAFILVSCEGPAGPQGDVGAQGIQGIQGVAGAVGPAGPSGTTNCIECHDNSGVIATKQAQYENSLHGMGENASYANRAGCVECHTNQGFHEFNLDITSTAPFAEAQQPNCYTCHDVHTAYDVTDWALTYDATHNLLLDGTAFDKGAANLCSKCHQARAVSPMPVIGGTGVDLTSDRWGTHHGPVANLLSGEGMYEVVGTATYANTMHSAIADGCVTCHMADGYSDMGGGHTMNMEYERHHVATLNDTGCKSCHTSGYTLADLQTFQAGIQVKLDALQALLLTAGIYDPGNGRNAKGVFTDDVAGAYLNWQTITEDRSKGVHNPKYINALLDNSIEALTPATK